MRTETIHKKEASDIKMPRKSNKKFTKAELDELVIRLAEAHDMM